jgi:hypothetical protein
LLQEDKPKKARIIQNAYRQRLARKELGRRQLLKANEKKLRIIQNIYRQRRARKEVRERKEGHSPYNFPALP